MFKSQSQKKQNTPVKTLNTDKLVKHELRPGAILDEHEINVTYSQTYV